MAEAAAAGKMKKDKKRGKPVTLIFVLILIAGLSLIAYPNFASWWNKMHQAEAVARYSEAVGALTEEEIERMWREAEDYNEWLSQRTYPFTLSDDMLEKYYSLFGIFEDNLIGYLDVPTADITLPIYHGVSDEVLQRGAGHIEWTSFPIGGDSTHSALSSHRGLPSARLFTDLDLVVEGDVFTIQILDRVMSYQVDQILTVIPEDVEPLYIVQGKDYCTLVTCTPYGVNSHRMLVRGHRVDNKIMPGEVRLVSEAILVNKFIVAVVIGTPLLIAAFVLMGRLEQRKDARKARIKKLFGNTGGTDIAKDD